MITQATGGDTPPFAEIDVLWITAGLGCDGDTISMTAATQPSLEDILLGGIPWIPKVRLHNQCLAYANGEAFLEPFHRAAAGALSPFILVIEGSIPNEHNKAEGYWASFGTDQKTGQPILTCDWIDRLAPQAWAVVAAGTCAAYGGMHGAPRLSGLGMEIKVGDSYRLRTRVSGSTRQLHGDVTLFAAYGHRAGSHDPSGRMSSPDLAIRSNRP